MSKKFGLPQRKQYVHQEHITKTVDAFQQYMDLSLREFSRRMGRREQYMSQLKAGQTVCTPKVSHWLFINLGYMIDDWVDEENDIPDQLKEAIIDYLDQLIQPFKVDEMLSKRARKKYGG